MCSLLFSVSEYIPFTSPFRSLCSLSLDFQTYAGACLSHHSFLLSLVFVSPVFQLPFSTLYILAIIAYSKLAFCFVSLSLYLFELFILRIS